MKTHIVVVLDKSGSMEPLTRDTIGGFNRFIREQRAEPGEADLTVILFDTVFKIPTGYDAVDIQAVVDLDEHIYQAGGNTALLDALDHAITKFEKKKKVIVLVMTDGQENSSRKTTLASIRERVSQKQNAGWAFTFIGAGIDAFADAGALGFATYSTAPVAASSAGISHAYYSMSSSTSNYRNTGVSCFCKDPMNHDATCPLSQTTTV